MDTFLPLTYFPHAENRMRHVGDTARSREVFLRDRPANLSFLLEQRYSWMIPYVESREKVIELGSGSGFAKEFIRSPNLKLTDVVKNPWIDEKVDALQMPYDDSTLDIIICSHMIHHLANPRRFFKEVTRVLKPGGLVLIQDLETSWLLRLLLRIMRHEGWSYEVDVFSPTAVCNSHEDPWSANCAIPELLFTDKTKFESHFPQFEIEKNELCECFTFVASGGVIAKTKTVQLSRGLLNGINHLDQFLIKLFPKFFALGRRVVLKKKVTL